MIDLEAIEERYHKFMMWQKDENFYTVNDSIQFEHRDIPALIAEVRRLRGMVDKAKMKRKTDPFSPCLWCDGIPTLDGYMHAPGCPDKDR